MYKRQLKNNKTITLQLLSIQAQLFLNYYGQRYNVALFNYTLYQVQKLYDRTNYKHLFLQEIYHILQQEWEQHLVYCSAYRNNKCRFDNFYTTTLIRLKQQIQQLQTRRENKIKTDRERYTPKKARRTQMQ